MERYASTGPQDAPSIQDGDNGFIGVNEWDAPESLKPGEVQSAVNVDFTTKDATTRGGFVCTPSLGATGTTITGGWTAYPSSNDYNWFSIAYGNNRFVAMRATISGAADSMYSTDNGQTWTTTGTLVTVHDWKSIAYGNGTFVVVPGWAAGGNQKFALTPDGHNWTTISSPSNFIWTGITYGGGLFVAVANYPGFAPYPDPGTTPIATSPDGVTWTLRSVPAAGASLPYSAVAYGNGIYVAASSTCVLSSTDGINWVATTSLPVAWTTISSIAYGNGVFVAVVAFPSANLIFTSEDGVTWTQRTAAAQYWRGIAFGNGYFAAVNSDGVAAHAIYMSQNGIDWAYSEAPNTKAWRAIAYGNGTFVAVPQASGGAYVMTKSYSSAPTNLGTIYGTSSFSDPNDPGAKYVMLAGSTAVSFYANGRETRTVSYAGGETVSETCTVVQANNQVFIFRGSSQTPLYWAGNWGGTFSTVTTPTLIPGFSGIPNSSQATYYQNRLWVVDGKDQIAASDVLDFTVYDEIANNFNLNTGDSDYIVATYPFGTETLLVFKNRSILALQNVGGSLLDVSATEITRLVGCVGPNAIVSVGPDIVYVGGQDINLLTLTQTNNSIQHKTLPLSAPIRKIMKRVNWRAGSAISLGYWSNKLYVALPLDNSSVCNTVVVHNFVTGSWYGEWNFADTIAMSIIGWTVVPYLGQLRMHAVTDDGRAFVTDEGHIDISGNTTADIPYSITTRAYPMNNDPRFGRRMWMDIETNRPTYSVTAYVDGANEYEVLLANETYARSQSWIWSDSTYSLTNSGDNYNREGRKDYAGYANESIQCRSGFLPEMDQSIRMPLVTRRRGRLSWFKVTNTTGKMALQTLGTEARPGDRGNLVQVL